MFVFGPHNIPKDIKDSLTGLLRVCVDATSDDPDV